MSNNKNNKAKTAPKSMAPKGGKSAQGKTQPKTESKLSMSSLIMIIVD